MRQIILDTETTGLDPREGHRIVEIGAIELINHIPTENFFQSYLDPDRMMSEGASAVSGITDAMLKGKPRFTDVVDRFLGFIGPSELVIHNAKFDMGFLNYEMLLAGRPSLENPVVDTIGLARRKFPGAPASLDALCRRFNIDLSSRAKHGALIDARLLASVYLELIGGRQPGLTFESHREAGQSMAAGRKETRVRPAPLAPRLTAEDRERHEAFLKADIKDALWLKSRRTVKS